MELYNNSITIEKILSDPEAAKTVEKYFPGAASHPMLSVAGKMTLAQLLRLAAGRIPREKVQALLEELRQL